MAKQSILILEDDPHWQEILSELVTDLRFKPVVVSSLDEALAALSVRRYALAIVDISLSMTNYADRRGVRFLKEINELYRKLPAVVVTGHATIDLAIETMAELEADYFIRKEQFDRHKFKDVVRAKALSDRDLSSLSERESEVLSLMSEGRTNPEIAEALAVSVNTVKKHVQNIFTKLNVSTRAAAVAKAAEQTH